MSFRVAIVNYRMGNVCSVRKALEHLGAEVYLADTQSELEAATHIILPGVGNFGHGMRALEQLELCQVLRELATKLPILGICLGMQLLFESSEEAPGVKGLGLVAGSLRRFQTKLPVPHVGWNEISGQNKPAIFSGVDNGSSFYFVHSYCAQLGEVLPHTTTSYDQEFVSALQSGKLFGVQFHPEKSQKKGLLLLKNFLELS